MFFKSHREPDTTQLQQTLNDIEARLSTFLQKLDERANELLEGFLAEAPGIIAADNHYGQGYSRFLAATRGQISTLRKKVQDVREQQVTQTMYQYDNAWPAGSSGNKLLYDWQNRCYERINNWEEALYAKETAAIEKAEWKDYEPLFRQLIDNYNTEKEKVHCKQCGAKLNIDRMYYYSTYVSCDFCQTQNIFDPGTNARLLEDTARKLAEQRCKPILDAHVHQQQRERALYHQAHELHLSMVHEKSASVLSQKKSTIDRLEAERQEAIRRAPELLEKYYRDMFDEMSILLPDLKEHNDRFFQSIKTSYLNRNH